MSKNYFLEDHSDCRVSNGPHKNSMFYIYIHNFFFIWGGTKILLDNSYLWFLSCLFFFKHSHTFYYSLFSREKKSELAIIPGIWINRFMLYMSLYQKCSFTCRKNICPALFRKVPVYACYFGVIIKSSFFYSQKSLSFEEKSYFHTSHKEVLW